jgi:hypothetical protein
MFACLLAAQSGWGDKLEPPKPVFIESFRDPPDSPEFLRRWRISNGLDAAIRKMRITTVSDASNGKHVVQINIRAGDVLDPGGADAAEAPYVCDTNGSRATLFEAAPGGGAPTERVEVQLNADGVTGAGELVKFGEPIWYRFSFKVLGDWPRDRPAAGRSLCRTVIHQIKQDSFLDGASCNASPFFKIEARPFGDRLQFFAQLASGDACASPPLTARTRICQSDALLRESWTTVYVRLLPAQDETGRADVWLNGRHCGTYRGPMGDAEHGARRAGVPFINVQPRFGIYRDRRAEQQTIRFDQIMMWSVDPTGHPDWSVAAAPP